MGFHYHLSVSHHKFAALEVEWYAGIAFLERRGLSSFGALLSLLLCIETFFQGAGGQN